jgi:hypothetical protein
MALKERQEALRKLQQVRDSKVLVHFLSDRRVAQGIAIPGMSTQLAGEPYRLIYEHLRALGRQAKLDLFLYTTGGLLDSVWPLVRLLRSFGKKFSVLVPMKALSAGTLLCLGADEIVMGEAAQLSPIDPTTANQFNPKEKDRPLPISVEDVTSYFDLARGEQTEEGVKGGVGLRSDEHILAVFKALTARVHPLALGNVKRVHSQIRDIARALLALHLPGHDSEDRVQRVVKRLTEELHSHAHLICRDEAVDILGEDFVAVPSQAEEAAMWALYQQYEELFHLNQTFNLKDWLGQDEDKDLEVVGAVIESEGTSHVFRAMNKVRQLSDIPPGVQVQVPPGQRMPLIPGLPTKIHIEAVRDGWYTNDEGV